MSLKLGKNEHFCISLVFLLVRKCILFIIFQIWGKMGKNFENLHNPHILALHLSILHWSHLFPYLVISTKYKIEISTICDPPFYSKYHRKVALVSWKLFRCKCKHIKIAKTKFSKQFDKRYWAINSSTASKEDFADKIDLLTFHTMKIWCIETWFMITNWTRSKNSCFDSICKNRYFHKNLAELLIYLTLMQACLCDLIYKLSIRVRIKNGYGIWVTNKVSFCNVY